jgi:hypothetical protein
MYQDAAPASTGEHTESTAEPAPARPKTIFRNVSRGERYTKLPNAMLQDTRLDLDERGALAMILSLPEHWDFSEEHFCRTNRIGHNRCRRIVRSLVKHGYCRRVRARDGKARWVGSVVYEFTNAPGNFPPEAIDPKQVNGEPLTQNASVAHASVGNGTGDTIEKKKTHTEETPPSEEGAQARLPTLVDDPVGSGRLKAKTRQEPLIDLPEDAMLPDDWRAVAVGHGLTDTQIDREWSRFKRWAAGANKTGRTIERTERGWSATWRNWVDSPAHVGTGIRQQASGAPEGYMDRALRRAAELELQP